MTLPLAKRNCTEADASSRAREPWRDYDNDRDDKPDDN